MEILFLIAAWLLLMYIIKIHKELYYYRKLHKRSDIYVQNLNEILYQNTWYKNLYNNKLTSLALLRRGTEGEVEIPNYTTRNEYVN